MILAAATDLQENFGWHVVDQKFLPLIKLAIYGAWKLVLKIEKIKNHFTKI